MVMTLDLTQTASIQVLGKAAAFYRHEIALRELHEWLARHTTWIMTGSSDDGLLLARRLDLTMAELELGHATEDDLWREIGEFFGQGSGASVNLHLGQDRQPRADSSSSSVTSLMVLTVGLVEPIAFGTASVTGS